MKAQLTSQVLNRLVTPAVGFFVVPNPIRSTSSFKRSEFEQASLLPDIRFALGESYLISANNENRIPPVKFIK